MAPRLAMAQDRLRIGLTAVILADQAAFLARWADYLSQRLGARVTFASRDQYQAVHELLNNGQVDAAWTCGYPYVRFQSQLQLLAVPLYWANRLPVIPDPAARWGGRCAAGATWPARCSPIRTHCRIPAGLSPRVSWRRRALPAGPQALLLRPRPSQRRRRGGIAPGRRRSIDGYVWETMRHAGHGRRDADRGDLEVPAARVSAAGRRVEQPSVAVRGAATGSDLAMSNDDAAAPC